MIREEWVELVFSSLFSDESDEVIDAADVVLFPLFVDGRATVSLLFFPEADVVELE